MRLDLREEGYYLEAETVQDKIYLKQYMGAHLSITYKKKGESGPFFMMVKIDEPREGADL